MGGSGSGWHRGGRSAVEDVQSVDVRRWHREGLLEPLDAPEHASNTHRWVWTSAQSGRETGAIQFVTHRDRIDFIYTVTRRGADTPPVSVRKTVALARTPCTYGGCRVWFVCPECRRRAAILYVNGPPACRHCRRLTYRSRNETDTHRAMNQCHNLQDKVGGTGGALERLGPRPKGMHRRTYERLREQHTQQRTVALSGICRMIGLPPPHDETKR